MEYPNVTFSLMLLYLTLAMVNFHFITEGATVSYSFAVQRMISSPDGYPRPLISVMNASTAPGTTDVRPFPGPMIRGKKGDTIEVSIYNRFETESTSVHFHGLHMRNNAWMDGVPMLTQPVIPPGEMFTYRFNLTQTGTYWYHSHSGMQYGDGLLGPIVVEYPDNEVDPVMQKFNYRNDYTIMIQDWFHENEDDLLLMYRGPFNAFRYSNGSRYEPNYPLSPTSVLMNGHGQFNCLYNNSAVQFFGSTSTTCVSKTEAIFGREPVFGPCDVNAHSPDEYRCTSGTSIRIRLIHAGNDPNIRFWIDQHRLIIVARDGVEVEPLNVDYVLFTIGQRMDVIVECSANQNLQYKMFAILDQFIQPVVWSSALLIYDGATQIAMPSFLPKDAPPAILSPSEFEHQLRPLIPKMAPPTSHRVVLQFSQVVSFNDGQPLEEYAINNISFVMPMKPLLQENYVGHGLGDAIVTNAPGPLGNLHQTNVLKLEYGQTYEFVLISMNIYDHPWHIHGYSASFVAYGVLNSTNDFNMGADACGSPIPVSIKDEVLQRLGPVTGKEAPVLMIGDSFNIPAFGYSIFRITLDNPGPWFFHCHVNFHMEVGMAMVWSVERNGTYPYLVPPPNDFPAYLPLAGFQSKSVY